MASRRRYLVFTTLATAVLLLILVQMGGLDSISWAKPAPSRLKPVSVSDHKSVDLSRPLTIIPQGAHAPGFTVLDNLYLRGGTFYVLSFDPSKFPPKRSLLSKPVEMGPNVDMGPTDQELQFIDPKNAEDVLGGYITRIPDLSIIIYDPPQFMRHLYHWWGEIIMGAWRVYSSLRENNMTTLPFPARFLLPFSEKGEWRDAPDVNGPLMRAAFPHSSIEQSEYWQDLIKLNTTVVFERAILVNRPAAHTHPFADIWFKMIAGTMNVTVLDNFWVPIQQSLVKNILGYLPNIGDRDMDMGSSTTAHTKPIVTYISRQRGTRRRLLREDYDGLISGLRELESEGICEVHVAIMETMSIKEQIELAARSTIIIGVHGNGLTHELWMPASSKSTIIEIFYPEGFIFDYEILARNLGHRHYIVWNDTLLTYLQGNYHKGINYPEGFHGSSIPVYGPAVTRTVRNRLLGYAP